MGEKVAVQGGAASERAKRPDIRIRSSCFIGQGGFNLYSSCEKKRNLLEGSREKEKKSRP